MTPPQVPILHHDEHLVIVSKPAGMLVHRDLHSRTHERVLLNTVRDQVGQYLFPVHRLDRNTSGTVAFALDAPAATALQERLRHPDTVKAYLALVRGITPNEFESDRPLTDKAGTPKPARTTFRTIAHLDRCSVIEARLHTGRHHQIRRHLSHLTHHIIGDTTHGKGGINRDFRALYALPRMFLHAWRLELDHPVTTQRLAIRDHLPHDLLNVLNNLGAQTLATQLAP